MRGSPPDAAELALGHQGARRIAAANGSESALVAWGFRYDERELRGFIDTHDERVYAAATARFWTDARRVGCVDSTTRTDTILITITIGVVAATRFSTSVS